MSISVERNGSGLTFRPVVKINRAVKDCTIILFVFYLTVLVLIP